MAKEKKEKKSRIPTLCNIKRFVAAVGGAFVLLGASIGLFGCNKHQSQTEVTTPPYKTEQEVTKQLPDFEDSLKFYEELGADTSYLSYEYTHGGTSNSLYDTRLAPQEDPITFNICIDDLSEKAKQVFENTAADLNEVFEAINPKYRFEVDFNPDQKARNNKYNIGVYLMTEEYAKENPKTWAFWRGTTYIKTIDGQTTVNSQINIREDALEVQGVFTHEVLHHLGLGDAYKVTKTDSIMQAGEQKYIRRNDLILLAGKYGDYSTPEKKAELIEFVDTYFLKKAQERFAQATESELEAFDEIKSYLAEYLGVDESEVKPLPNNSVIINEKYDYEKNLYQYIYKDGTLDKYSLGYNIWEDLANYKYSARRSINNTFYDGNTEFTNPYGYASYSETHKNYYCYFYAEVNGIPYKLYKKPNSLYIEIEKFGKFATEEDLDKFYKMKDNLEIAKNEARNIEELFRDAINIPKYKFKDDLKKLTIGKDGEQIFQYNFVNNSAIICGENKEHYYTHAASGETSIYITMYPGSQKMIFMPVSPDGKLLCYGYDYDGNFFTDEYEIIPEQGQQMSDIIDLSQEVEQ